MDIMKSLRGSLVIRTNNTEKDDWGSFYAHDGEITYEEDVGYWTKETWMEGTCDHCYGLDGHVDGPFATLEEALRSFSQDVSDQLREGLPFFDEDNNHD